LKLKINKPYGKMLVAGSLALLTVILFQNCQQGRINRGTLLNSSQGVSVTPGSPNTPVPPLPVPDPSANLKLFNLNANTALDLGQFHCDQPTDGGSCYAGTDYSRLTYDSQTHQVFSWGGGHGIEVHTDVQALSLETLAWAAHTPSTLCADMTTENIVPETASWRTTGQPFARHTWDMGVMLELNGARKYMLLSSGGIGNNQAEGCNVSGVAKFPAATITAKIMIYDVTTGKWSFSKQKPDALWYYASAAEYDPVSKMIVVVNGEGGSIYDPVKDEVIAHFPSAGALPGYSNNLVYYPPNQKMYYVQRGATTNVTEIELIRNNWSATTPKTVSTNGPSSEESGWAYDNRSQVIGGGVLDGKISIYNPMSNSWSVETMTLQTDYGTTVIGSMPGSSHALDFDSNEGVFIFLAGGHTWAYRYR
jgi:hypothetical protein